jgi:hypothetical protein
LRYQSGNISIDDSFARFGSKSYAIDKINSVEVREKRRGSGCGPLLLFVIGGLMLIGALGNFAGGSSGVGIGSAVIGALLILGGVKAQKTAQLIDYTLVLTTSSSEAQALESTDRNEVMQVRDAIEGAMSGK